MTTTQAPPTQATEVHGDAENPLKAGAFEDLKVDGEQLLAKVRELIHEGNVRRVIIKNDEGMTLLEIPLTLGVAGAVLLPSLAAVGAIAALVTDCSITVERVAAEPMP
jgi:hypothetical protein